MTSDIYSAYKKYCLIGSPIPKEFNQNIFNFRDFDNWNIRIHCPFIFACATEDRFSDIYLHVLTFIRIGKLPFYLLQK
jgi:hypothetical protein